ncbi:MAG: glycoside hydrolase family 19 protein [Blastocatellia bacterium]|nr:glycoside hydrolase family 19 protein [Blastocatellia bacterium]
MSGITLEQFHAFAPTANPAWSAELVAAINEFFPKFGITTPARVAAFMAQAAHETGGFTRLTENLNYSAPGLVATFPNRFDRSTATIYARQPERIANRAYANKLGNGDERSGDGWRYRGRGIFQLTGKDNYRAYGKACGQDWLNHPELVAEPRGAVLSACAYWSANSLSGLADVGNFRELTRKINRALLGLTEREAFHKAAKKIFANVTFL